MSLSVTETQWDAIVIGTGIGGGTVGRSLAEAGQKVLFIEKGPAGFRSEEQGLDQGVFLPEARLARGYWPEPVTAKLNGVEASFFAPLGAGVGGSSVFYAATLERPERHDLDALPERPHPTGGWPVGFDAMRPWYDRAAQFYALTGTDDPLSGEPPLPLLQPPEPDPGDAALLASFAAQGLHPYRAHSAIRHIDGCRMCLGRKCPRACKMDGRSAGVEPALATGNAALLDSATATRLLSDEGRITGVEIRRHGETLTLTARRYILAGGALGSPRLLLASKSEAWPDGIANRTGLVGRNLMFHLNEIIALWPPRAARTGGPSKSVAFRDLYWRDGMRMGVVQAMGVDASYGEIVHYLNRLVDQSALSRIPGLRAGTRLPAALAAKVFGSAKLFVGLLEDLPYPHNRVTTDPSSPDRIRIDYTFSDELLARRRAFRRAMKTALRGHRRFFVSRLPDLNYGHPCGTLRFGTDPATAVLDPTCRAHGLDNLFVVDASFMPTSFGVNPSLTIAANALRVGDAIAKGETP